MQRHGTELPTRAELPVLRAIEARGTAMPRDVADAAPSLGAAKQYVWRLTHRGLLQRTEGGYAVAHATNDLIALMMEGL
jgi:hypothetical protein